jgi:hypothetical protein
VHRRGGGRQAHPLREALGARREEAQGVLDAVAGNRSKQMGRFNARFVPAIRHAYRSIPERRARRNLHFRAVYLQEWITDPNFPLICGCKGRRRQRRDSAIRRATSTSPASSSASGVG